MSARNTVSNGGVSQGAFSEPAISSAHRHTHSEAFKALFREGMNLVEEAAGYLDGPGRAASKARRRPAALAYATESMRLTTRLMQIASWLLLRRAVNDGEITQAQAQSERHRVRLTRQELSCDSVMLDELPAEFTDLAERSLRLQSRVMHLDRSFAEPQLAAAPPTDHPLTQQLARGEAAFRGL